MKENNLPKLTPAEFELMEIIWDSEESTVTEILNGYNSRVDKSKHVTRSTIQVQVTRLAKKGWLKYRQEKNKFYYSATKKREKVKREIAQDINKRIFGGSCANLMSALFEQNEISKDEIAKLRELLNRKENLK